MMKKKLSLLLALVLSFVLCAFAFTACTPTGGGDDGDENALGFDSALELEVGSSKTIKSNGGKETTWSVDDETVLQLNKTEGSLIRITALKEGVAVLTAEADGVTATCTVTVVKKAEAEVVTIMNSGAAVTTLTASEGDADIQLSASSSKGSTISAWESTNTSVATVDNTGKVKIVHMGTTDIYAKVTESIKGKVTLTVTAAGGQTGYIPVMAATEDFDPETKHKDQVGKYMYYSESVANGMPEQVKLIEVRNGNTINFETESHYAAWYSFQLYKKDLALDAGKRHRISCKIKLEGVKQGAAMSATDVDKVHVTFCGQEFEVQSGVETDLSVVAQPLFGPYNMQFLFILGWLADDYNGYSSCKGTLSNITFQDVSSLTAPLTAPSFTLNGDKVIITDTNAKSDVSGYELGFFSNASDAAPVKAISVSSENGYSVNTKMVYPDGEYTVRLRAIPSQNSTYTTSAWSTDTATMTVSNGADIGKQKLIFAGGGSDGVKIAQNRDKWAIWYRHNPGWGGVSGLVVESDFNEFHEYADGRIVVDFKAPAAGAAGANAVQLNYMSSTITSGSYKVTFYVESSVDATININGQNKTIVANQSNYVEVVMDTYPSGEYECTFGLAFGSINGGSVGTLTPGRYVFSGFKFTALE